MKNEELKSNMKTKDEGEQKELESQLWYVSNIDEIGSNELIKEGKKESNQFSQKLYFFVAYLVDFLILLLIPSLLFFAGIFIGVSEMLKAQIKTVLRTIWMLLVSASVIYCLINYFFLNIENPITASLVQDCIYFYLSSLLVFSFLMANFQTELNSFSQAFQNCELDRTLSTFQYLSRQESDTIAYFLDFKNFQNAEFISDFARKQITTSMKFNYLLLNKKNHTIEKEQSSLYSDHAKYIEPSHSHFVLLLSIIVIKLLFAIHYINIFSDELTTKDIFDIVLLIFCYIYTTFNLNRILGNNDLKRKSLAMNQIQSFVDFSKISENDPYTSKLDITCPISIETWDNARKTILSYQKEYLQDMEVSYFCLIFYYLFVILVIFSAYFDLNWIISKESPLLQPIVVIVSTFNFVFLSTFLLLRFYQGQTFNDTFDDHAQCITQLIDVMEDLLTMYDSLFIDKNRQLNGLYELQKKQIYAILIKKFKQTSNLYIEEQVIYHDKIYQKSEKNILTRKMIENVKQSLKKVKKQIDSDSLSLKYKFLNIMEIKFSDFVVTLAFGLVTTLPTIIPKFLDFFQKK